MCCKRHPVALPRFAGPLLPGSHRGLRQPPVSQRFKPSAESGDSPRSHPRFAGPLLPGSHR